MFFGGSQRRPVGYQTERRLTTDDVGMDGNAVHINLPVGRGPSRSGHPSTLRLRKQGERSRPEGDERGSLLSAPQKDEVLPVIPPS